MKTEPSLQSSLDGYKRVRFNTRMDGLLRTRDDLFYARTATRSELESISHRIRRDLGGLAADAVVKRLREHNPSIFQIVESKDERAKTLGLYAALPLTEDGVAAVTSGRFDPADPDLAHVARAAVPVSAIYVWVIYSPRAFVSVVRALSDQVAERAPNGCSLFCRGATRKSYALMCDIGFEEAGKTFPGAPKGLLVIHPQVEKKATELCPVPPQTRIELVRNLADFTQIAAIRAATYMSEQECPFDEEFDGNDLCAAHLIGRIDGEPAGCIRVRFFAGFIKLERLAVRREFRKSKLAFQLVREAIRYARVKGYTKVYGHARADLVPFWQAFGFRVIQGRPKFQFSDVEYVEMMGELSKAENPVSIGDCPFRMIRPEGQWEVPGPLERIQNRERSNRIASQFRHAA